MENPHPIKGKVIVFLRTSSTARCPLYKHIREVCGAITIVVHPIINPLFDGLFDHWIQHDTNDVDALEMVLSAKLTELGLVPDAITTFDEYGVYPAAVLNERRGWRPMPFASSIVADTAVKSTFREISKDIGLNAPKSVKVVTPHDDPVAAVNGGCIVYPVVVKPSPGAGSLLTKLIYSDDELVEYLRFLWVKLSQHPDQKHLCILGTSVHIVIEEYITGQEVDVDCVVENGKVLFAEVSDNFEMNFPYFCEVGGLCPTALKPEERQCVLDLLYKYVDYYKDKIHAVLHFEAKYDFERKAAFVIEVNCRMGSAEVFTMISNIFGVNLGECVARLALNIPCLPILSNIQSVDRPQYCASVNLYPNKSGILESMKINEDDPDLITYNYSSQKGQRVAPPPDMFYMLAWAVVRGDSAESAKTNIDRISASFEHTVADVK
eukprot:Tbor_TRINITY_DN4816_c0_g1::TRINITY_DN4816_c0_g1_i1::g.1408::m.1408